MNHSPVPFRYEWPGQRPSSGNVCKCHICQVADNTSTSALLRANQQRRGFARFERHYPHCEITRTHWYHAYLEICGTLWYGDIATNNRPVQTTSSLRSTQLSQVHYIITHDVV